MVKSDFLQFSAKDFILDETFQHWINKPDHAPSNEWQGWLTKYPERISVIESARSFIAVVRESLDEVVALEEAEESWMEVQGRLVLL